MSIEEWFERYPWQNLCPRCKGTGLRHDWTKDGDFLPVEPKAPCLDCLGDRLHFALRKRRR
jgi:hypothetical protein